MEEMDLAVKAATSPQVQLWMNWMLAIFAVSLLFAWKFPPARFVLASFVLSVIASVLIFKLTKEPHLLGIGHIVFWGPLAFYLYQKVLKGPGFKLSSIYGVWIVLLLATIAVSLVFDVRDVILVLSGNK